ncbi:hypothetical protein MUK42_03615 [Musa troglodytarum]|uniref:Uncharacterized protein n=1 Tax=Musa troglodytarum TaxID=320322 RepID=A0A9E7HTU3_9LILI|nr:hypothetical protein MUK42_03615 [Musa troglodytarum]
MTADTRRRHGLSCFPSASPSPSCSLAHLLPFSVTASSFLGRDGPIRWMDSVLDVVPSSSHGEARPECDPARFLMPGGRR